MFLIMVSIISTANSLSSTSADNDTNMFSVLVSYEIHLSHVEEQMPEYLQQFLFTSICTSFQSLWIFFMNLSSPLKRLSTTKKRRLAHDSVVSNTTIAFRDKHTMPKFKITRIDYPIKKYFRYNFHPATVTVIIWKLIPK